MSASTRGIVVAADGLDLVVRATAAEVAQFVKGKPVDAAQGLSLSEAVWRLREEGWRLVPNNNYASLSWPHDPPSSCAALLRTRCGCEQVRPVVYPPPETVRLVVDYPGYGLQPEDFDMAQQIRLAVREFGRTGRTMLREHLRVYEYLEEV